MKILDVIAVIAAIVSIVSFLWYFYEKKFPIKRFPWRHAERGARAVVGKMLHDSFTPSLIFGIGRGGAIFGSLISGCLGHRPLVVLDRQYSWSEKGRIDDLLFPISIPSEYLDSVLLVAGEAHSGGTMNRYYEYLKSVGASDIRRAVLYLEEGCVINIEYYGIKGVRKNISMPWMFSKRYARADRSPAVSPKHESHLILYLVRHGETTAGEDIFAGREDFDLTLDGIKQSLSLGRQFLPKRVKTIFSSPLGRAVKTATIVHGFIPIANFVLDEDLQEMDFGKWDGLSRELIEKRYSEAYRHWMKNPVKTIPPDAEQPEKVLQRMRSFLEGIEKRHRSSEDQEFVVVSHKTAIRILISFVQGRDLETYRQTDVANGQVFKLIYDGSRWRLESLEKHLT